MSNRLLKKSRLARYRRSRSAAEPIIVINPVPDAPESPAIVYEPSTTSLDLTWSAPSGGSTPTGYTVKRSATAGGPYTTIATTASTSYSDEDVPYEKERFYYVISAYNETGNGNNSSEVSDVCYFPVRYVFFRQGAGIILGYAPLNNSFFTTLRDFANNVDIQDAEYCYGMDWALVAENDINVISQWQFAHNGPLFGSFLHGSLTAAWGVRAYQDSIWYSARNGTSTSLYRQDRYDDNSGTATSYDNTVAQVNTLYIDRTNEEVYIGLSGGRVMKRSVDGTGSFININGTTKIGTPSNASTFVYDHINDQYIYGDGGTTIYRKNADFSGSEESLTLSVGCTSLYIDFASNELICGLLTGWVRVNLSTFTVVSGSYVTSYGSVTVTDVQGIGTNINHKVTPDVYISDGKVYLDFEPFIKLDFDSVEVFRSTSEGGTYSSLGTVSDVLDESNKMYVDSAVSNGTTYYYKVQPTDVLGNVYPLGNIVSATPTAITDLPTTGLVALYKFDEGSGSIVTDSVGTDHGTVVNGSWDAEGLIFNGSSTTVNMNSPSLGGVTLDINKNRSTGESFTFLVVARADDTSANVILAKSDTGVSTAQQFVLRSSSNNIDIRLLGELTILSSANGQEIKVIQLTWHSEKNEMYGWIDTTETFMGDGVISPEVTPNFYLGSRANSSDFLNGKIYYMAVWNKRMTPAEAIRNYNIMYDIMADRGVSLVAAKV